MVKYGGWGLLMFLEPLSKGSGGFPYIFLITLHPVTLVPIDDSTLFHKRIFVLGSHQEAFDGITSFKVYLHSIFLASSFEAFTQPFIIWHHYVVLFWLPVMQLLFFFLLFFWGLVPSFLSLPCWLPNQGIYIWSGLSSDVALLAATIQGLSIWCLPCNVGWKSHYIENW